MADIVYRSDMDVELVDSMGNDGSVIKAAKVSTLGSKDVTDMTREGQHRFIQFLVENRHGSPFEHVTFTFRITAPIFVWREFMRHRMASYSEESARYKQLEPVFYVPDASRNLIQVGKAGEHSFQAGSANHYEFTTVHLKNAARRAYESYEAMLRMGIAREVARMCLPVNIYSTAYVTMNLRALTNFLSLRVKDGTSMFPSFPQREIEMVAERMEALVEEVVPITFSLFHSSGRVPL